MNEQFGPFTAISKLSCISGSKTRRDHCRLSRLTATTLRQNNTGDAARADSLAVARLGPHQERVTCSDFCLTAYTARSRDNQESAAARCLPYIELSRLSTRAHLAHGHVICAPEAGQWNCKLAVNLLCPRFEAWASRKSTVGPQENSSSVPLG